MRDFLPADVRRRRYVIGVVEKIYQQYGFDPLETPDDRSCFVHTPEARPRDRACVCRPVSTPARLRHDIRAGTR